MTNCSWQTGQATTRPISSGGQLISERQRGQYVAAGGTGTTDAIGASTRWATGGADAVGTGDGMVPNGNSGEPGMMSSILPRTVLFSIGGGFGGSGIWTRWPHFGQGPFPPALSSGAEIVVLQVGQAKRIIGASPHGVGPSWK